MLGVPVRSVGLASLSLAICIGLLFASEERAVAADDRLATVSDFPVGCSASDYWPNRWQGRLIAKSESGCTSDWYMRLTVRLERRIDGVWRSVASATAEAAQPTTSLIVRVSVHCRLGRYRTYGLHAFRQDPADPWQVTPFFSAVVDVVNCPN
jgi:hypothetical protein